MGEKENENESENKTEKIIYQNYFAEKTKFEIIEDKVKKTLFGVLNILLKFEDDDFSDEVIDLLNETGQFLYYPFYDPMGYLWKKQTLFNTISKFLSYFQTVVFFNNTELYILFFYFLMAVVLGVCVDVGYVAYIISSKNKSGAVWPMRLLRSVVSYIVTVMFNPMVEYFLAILECSDKDTEGNQLSYYQNYNVDDMECWTNVHFTVMCVEGVVITIIFVLICTVVMTIFYEQKTSMDKEEAKTNSKADLMSLFVKIVLILIYSFLVWTKDYHWIVVPATTLTCFLQFYVYWVERPFYEDRTNMAFFLHTGIVFYSTVVLFLTKCLENTEFDGGVFILLFGGCMVAFIIITQKDDRFNLLLTNINKFDKGDSVFKQIRYLLELIDKSKEDRKSNILLKGYLYVHEESCTNPDCPLKKYLKDLEKSECTNNLNTNTGDISGTNIMSSQRDKGTGIESTTVNPKLSSDEEYLYLYQYATDMYQGGISKFPLCTSLRINYSFFLMERMNNTKKALIELKNCEKYNPSFEEEFIIFRFCENEGAQNAEGGEDEDEEDDEGLDIVANIAYKNHFNTFKEGLTQITAIYYDFWTLLLNNGQRSEEDLTKMNEYGDKINKLVEVVKTHYAEMEKLKYNDEEVLNLYSDFFQDILNDKTQAEYYRGRLRDIQGNGVQEINNLNDPLDTSNENIDYIFLTAEGITIGKIVKASVNFCAMLGYSPNELIGKQLDMILPEIFIKSHHKMLQEKASRYKTQLVQNVREGITEEGNSGKELLVFAKNKLNYIVPMQMKICLKFDQETNELFFIARVNNNELYEDFRDENPEKGIPPIINFNMKVCYVLTNTDFIVQYYTPNASNFLGFKVGASGNFDITKNLNAFGKNDDGLDLKKMSKSEYLKAKYRDKKIVIWKTLLTDNNDYDRDIGRGVVEKTDMKGFYAYTKGLENEKNDAQNDKPMQLMQFKRQKFKESYFYLKVHEESIKGIPIGYIFRFEIANDLEENEAGGLDEKHHIKKSNSVMDINESFVPEVKKNFFLDTKKMCFLMKNHSKIEGKPNSSEDDYEEDEDDGLIKDWHKSLRNMANEKITKFKQEKLLRQQNEEEEDEEDDDEEEEDEEEEDIEKSEKDFNNPHESSQFGSNIYDNQNEASDFASQSKHVSRGQTLEKRDTLSKGKGINKQFSSQYSLETMKKIDAMKKAERPNRYEYQYYHVSNLNAIRFMIYDPKKGRLIDVPNIKRESQVEYKKKEEPPKYQNIYCKKEEKDNEDEEEENNEENKDEINDTAEGKRIEYALQKEAFQPEIMRLKWISLITYVCLMIISASLLYIVINNYSRLKLIVDTLNTSRLLQQNLLIGLYYMREIVLLNHKEYNKSLLPSENDEMFMSIEKYLSENFPKTEEFLNAVRACDISWSEGRKNRLINDEVMTYLIDDSLNAVEIPMKCSNALEYMQSAIYEVIKSSSSGSYQTSTNPYYYTTNIISPCIEELEENFKDILYELSSAISHYKKMNLIIIFISLLILSVSGVFLKLTLDKIITRKSGYLEVFFMIEENVCRKALDKCDKYSKILNPVSENDEESVNSENDSILKKKKAGAFRESGGEKRQKLNQKKKICINLKDAFRISVLYLFIFIVYIFIIVYLQMSMSSLSTYTTLYNITTVEAIENQKLFDCLREYLFDPHSYTGIKSFKSILENKTQNLYEYQKQKDENFDFEQLPSSFKNKYKNVLFGDLCGYANELFNGTQENNRINIMYYTCSNLTENSSDYGMNLLISYYQEEIRTMKNLFDVMWEEASTIFPNGYNNSLLEYELEREETHKDYDGCLNKSQIKDDNDLQKYKNIDPIKIFNEETLFKLSMIRRYFILPTYNYTLNEFYESIDTFWKNKYNLFLIILTVLIVLISLFYFFYWIPNIYSMDEDIYKTKNMLSIIPKDVLATIPNISNLLGLGNISMANLAQQSVNNKRRKKMKLNEID